MFEEKNYVLLCIIAIEGREKIRGII